MSAAEELRERVIRVVLAAGREVDVNAVRAIVADLAPELEQLRAAIERVRQRHHRVGWDGMAHDPYCAAEGNPHLPWPCPTIAALDGDS